MSDRIFYDRIKPENSDLVSDFLLQNFFPNEPISRALGLPISQVRRWFPATVAESIKQDVSVLARNAQGQIIGVAINIVVEKDLRHEETGEGRGLLDILDPKFEPVMVEIAKFLGFLNQVPSQIYSTERSVNGKIRTLNCIYLNVLPSYGGRGIGRKLVEMSEDIGREKDVHFLQVDTTSEFSYRIFSKCGFDVVHEIPLASHLPGIDKVDDGIHRYGRILLKPLNN